jgi:hypothetical protein
MSYGTALVVKVRLRSWTTKRSVSLRAAAAAFAYISSCTRLNDEYINSFATGTPIEGWVCLFFIGVKSSQILARNGTAFSAAPCHF